MTTTTTTVCVFLFMFSILSRRCPLLASSLSALFCLLSMLISDSRFDLVWFRLSCDHGWIRSGSVNVRKQQQQQQQLSTEDAEPRLVATSYTVRAYRSIETQNTFSQHTHFIPIVGVGKRGEYQLVHGDLPRQHPFGITLRFTGPVPADSRQ